MSRWEPNAKGRLEQAALDLFQERGFEQTTVAQIAERAGLNVRTFFRYFADKREVLSGGQAMLQEIAVNTISNQPATAVPIELVTSALKAMAAAVPDRPDFIKQLQAVIALNPELQERELLKMTTLTATLCEGLRQRGVSDTTARLLAETGIAVFRVAFDRWAKRTSQQTFPQLVQESLDELKVVLIS